MVGEMIDKPAETKPEVYMAVTSVDPSIKEWANKVGKPALEAMRSQAIHNGYAGIGEPRIKEDTHNGDKIWKIIVNRIVKDGN